MGKRQDNSISETANCGYDSNVKGVELSQTNNAEAACHFSITVCSSSEFIFLKLVNLFGQLVRLLAWGISPMQGLYIHTEKH
jgi:hypothetical protein